MGRNKVRPEPKSRYITGQSDGMPAAATMGNWALQFACPTLGVIATCIPWPILHIFGVQVISQITHLGVYAQTGISMH